MKPATLELMAEWAHDQIDALQLWLRQRQQRKAMAQIKRDITRLEGVIARHPVCQLRPPIQQQRRVSHPATRQRLN